VEFYGEDHMEPDLYVGFAKFEERQKEVGYLYSSGHILFYYNV